MKKIRQGFDEKANEQLVIIEYRVMRGGDNLKLSKKKRKEQGGMRRAKKLKVGELFRDIHTRVMTGDEPPQVEPGNTGETSPDSNYPL